jgi:hypothetical protein
LRRICVAESKNDKLKAGLKHLKREIDEGKETLTQLVEEVCSSELSILPLARHFIACHLPFNLVV